MTKSTTTQQKYLKFEVFLRAIVSQPGDALPRLILADALEEHGFDREAAGQRWAAREVKYPLHQGPGGGWFTSNCTLPYHCSLPVDVFWPKGSWNCNENYYNVIKPLHCEQWFLRRCGEIHWNDQGEPEEPE